MSPEAQTMETPMFCFQCEQTAGNTGCTKHGVCGKSAEVATLQDLLVQSTKCIAAWMRRANELGANDPEVGRFVAASLFMTLTNVDFDPERIAEQIREAVKMRDRAKALYEEAAKKAGKEPEQVGVRCPQPGTMEEMLERGRAVSIPSREQKYGKDVADLMELVTYGLKGAAAYIDHAAILGQEDEELYAKVFEQLDYLNSENPDAGELVTRALQAGEINLRAMELLDAANTGTYGHPEPTQVRITPVKGKAILVSGHDLGDLDALLQQTEGKGINVYTHGEMLPCNAYPGLKKYDHLVGNYGGAWQNQQTEFDEFPGAILMTTNCLMRPQKSYQDRIFTTGLVGWPEVTHVPDRNDFSKVIEAAEAQPGFTEDAEEKRIPIGFAHNAVMGVADTVVQAVKDGAIRHFFLIGGCDGARPGRNYYTEFAEKVPQDCAILTLACGKYRFNKMEFGDIGGIPRLLDCGQCNDAYSAIQIALALSKAFNCDVNDLPLSLILSWYEQKAVAILLTLLHLGIRDMRIGPTLPAFVPDSLLKVLMEKFDLKAVSTPEEDLKTILG